MLSSHTKKADALLAEWQAVFGDRVYLAVKRTQRPNEDRFIEQAIRLSNAYQIPMIASQNPNCRHPQCALFDPR